MKKLGIVLLATAATLAISPARSLADTIVLEFSKSSFTSAAPTVTATKTSTKIVKGKPVTTYGTISAVGGTGLNINVADDGNPDGFDINASHTVSTAVNIGSISAGPTGTWTFSTPPPGLTAYYGGLGNSVLTISSSACVGGAHPGVCLSGTDGAGTLQISSGTHLSGDFTGTFAPTYISPYITGLFGDPTTTPAELAALNPDGGFATYLTLPTSTALKSTTTSVTETLDGQGFIYVNVNSPTPEPSSLILLGSGLLGLAFVAFRKSKSSGLVSRS